MMETWQVIVLYLAAVALFAFLAYCMMRGNRG